MADYPDYQRLVRIVGSDITLTIEVDAVNVTLDINLVSADIMMPIDLQASYIMMPVDIQGQYITLEIDIVAQTVGNIEVDLVAQTVGNIEVDIKAQTIGDITISIDAQNVGVYLQPDWQTLQGTDKNLTGLGSVALGTTLEVIDYTIPAGKTFYICQWGGGVINDASMYGILQYKHNTTYTTVAMNGGAMGCAQSFTKPVAVVTSDHIILKLLHWHTSDSTVIGVVGGYEI